MDYLQHRFGKVSFSKLAFAKKLTVKKISQTDVYDVLNKVIYLLTDLSYISVTVTKFMNIF